MTVEVDLVDSVLENNHSLLGFEGASEEVLDHGLEALRSVGHLPRRPLRSDHRAPHPFGATPQNVVRVGEKPTTSSCVRTRNFVGPPVSAATRSMSRRTGPPRSDNAHSLITSSTLLVQGCWAAFAAARCSRHASRAFAWSSVRSVRSL